MKKLNIILFIITTVFMSAVVTVNAQNKAERTASAQAYYGYPGAKPKFKKAKKQKGKKRKAKKPKSLRTKGVRNRVYPY